MNLNVNGLILMALVLLYIASYLSIITILNKFTSLEELYLRNNKRLSLVLSLIRRRFDVTVETLREVKNLRQNLILEGMEDHLQSKEIKKVESQEIKRLNSQRIIVRKEASSNLGLVGSDRARLALESAFVIEKNSAVKLYISNALTDIRNPESLHCMIPALINMHKWYSEKAISNILEFGEAVHPHFEALKESKNIEIIELLVRYAGENFTPSTKAFLFGWVDEFSQRESEFLKYYEDAAREGRMAYKLSYLATDLNHLLSAACRTLSNYYYNDFGQERYYTHANPIVQTNAFWALSKNNTMENFAIAMKFLGEARHEKAIIGVLTKMVEANPRLLYMLEAHFEKEADALIRRRIAQVLSNKIEYYILKLASGKDSRAENILVEIIHNGKINELIGFLNINRDTDIENHVIRILKEQVASESEMAREFSTYLDERIIRKWGLEPDLTEKSAQTHRKDPKLVRSVLWLTVLSVLFAPMLFLLTKQAWVWTAPPFTVLRQFVIDFNYGLVFYSIAVNFIYIALLVLSYQNVRAQARLWNLKNISMLFRSKMLPSISIIAPAYNEEKNIIESTKSLLNLNYPDYELLIVNDGSKDDTLLRLIQGFGLVRVDYAYTVSLITEPIRGIYRNPSLPKLVVIDKSNGGKADSLNAGINVANKTYFCGIDADSLLEPEALLRLASLTLDESVETPALGGNIFPINGCTVDKGLITDVRIPKNPWARFQTIEYLRAFMAGRLGWQRLNTLMIISGAFGLFRKDRIIGIGGYMTQNSIYQKDTVGEDMELVVRISRLMHEMRHPYKILYAFNANCWTEVPEDLKSLKSQRFRWHRGLIDILFFHRKMLFNKSYGRVGMLAMPYFYIFEAFGPMLEFQGYIMVILAAFLGILDTQIALLLFMSTILLGIIVSLTSLLIAERETHYFKIGDVLRLIGYAFIENFGPRQLFGIWRVLGQINIIFGQGGWGQIKRKGVAS